MNKTIMPTVVNPPKIAKRLALAGSVQGVGLRPAVAALAQTCKLAGSVRNTAQGVVVEIEGTAADVAEFERQLPQSLPAGTQLTQLQSRPIRSTNRHGFTIDHSTIAGPLQAAVPADLAVCSHCLAEVDDRCNRRAHYSFTSCVACGPRYSIIAQMPYDRARTSMAAFALCDRCQAEYSGLRDRRFHAQTNACPKCGPQLWASDAHGHIVVRDTAAIDAAVATLRQGQIVALRGIGGYQLLVDATSDAAVMQLRQHKVRPAKPLAVMVATLAAAEQIATLSPVERASLTSSANPIVVAVQPATSGLSRHISGPFNSVGVMLPTTPLHYLLAARMGRPLVATSGNIEGEPLEYEPAAAMNALPAIAQLWLHHNREIVRPIDDAVVCVIANHAVSLRLGRGLAPLSLELPTSLPGLATGGDQKGAIAFTNGSHAVLGPHVGDLETIATRQRWAGHVSAFTNLYGESPQWIAHDLHPDFFTTRWAAARQLPTVAVQHHHAHAVAAMLQHGWLASPALAVVWDGTGYGTDGTIWGGEGLLATAADFTRVAHCRPFSLPGGETAIRQPWRTAISVLSQIVDVETITRVLAPQVEPPQVAQVAQLSARAQFSLRTTSMGRLFDVAAVLILDLHHAQFDGQPAMLLEAACDPAATGSYQLPLSAEVPGQWDWRGMLTQLLADRARNVLPGTMAMRFHRALATAIDTLRRRHPNLPVVLGGGVFQNRVLVELVAQQAHAWRQPLGLPGSIPPGDGGLAAGQLAVAIARLNKTSTNFTKL